MFFTIGLYRLFLSQFNQQMPCSLRSWHLFYSPYIVFVFLCAYIFYDKWFVRCFIYNKGRKLKVCYFHFNPPFFVSVLLHFIFLF